MPRGYFYQEKLTESTVAGTTETVVTSISFDPDANSTYWLLASGQFTCNTAVDNQYGHVAVYHSESATVEICHQIYRAKEVATPQDYVPWFTLGRLDFGAAPGTHGVRVVIWSEVAGDTTACKNTRLVLIKSYDGDLYAEALTQTQTDTITYTTHVVLSVSSTQAANFLVIGGGATSVDINSSGAMTRLNFSTDGIIKGGHTWRNLDDFDYTSVVWQNLLTVTAGTVHTVALQYRALTTAVPAYFKEGRILALKTAGFDNAHYVEGSVSASTTSSSDFSMLTVSDTLVVGALPTLVIGTADVAPGSATISNYWGMKKETTVISEFVKEANTAGAYMASGVAFIETLTAGEQHSWSWYTRSEASSSMAWDDVAISWFHLAVEADPQMSLGATGFAQAVGFGTVPVICPGGF